MRRNVLLAAVLSIVFNPGSAGAQYGQGGFVLAGQGAGGNGLVDARFSVEMGYTIEVGERNGAYLGGRSTLGIHPLRANQQGLLDLHGNGTGTVKGGGGTLYDTGADIEIGYGMGVVRAYGFVGIHYLQQFVNPATIESGGEEVEVITRRRDTITNGRGLGVHLRLTDTGALVAEHYRGGGDDGVMRISGTRFGLRWIL
ncbi:hypothetical protein [Longimicrobium sp.]|uniref:hypothetical protein n=1 Tax=Longimicrobium sp. TaxID=2029185 RepID=UPI003B3A7183